MQYMQIVWMNRCELFNTFSAGIDFGRQNMTSKDRLFTSESDVYRRHILTSKVDSCTMYCERVNILIMALDT